MPKKKNPVLERQLKIRETLWPEVTEEMLWGGKETQGFSMVPRTMPLMMDIMDDLSGKGIPVSRTYLEMWCRVRDERFIMLNRPEEMAFHAGFSGQRALRTWKDRVRRLHDLGFINVKPGPVGDLSYAIFLNPYHVIKRAYLKGDVSQAKWDALAIRALEIKAFDLEDLDERGDLILPDDEEDGDKKGGAADASAPSEVI